MERILLKSIRLFYSCSLAFLYPVFASGYDKSTGDANPIPPAPAALIKNVGQVKDQTGRVRSDIDYKIDGGAISMFVGKGSLHYMWYMPGNKITGSNESGAISTYRLDVELVGCNKNAEVTAQDKLPYYENYYLQDCQGKTAHSYRKIVYHNIYPKIDWVLYTDETSKGFKYDFIVHAGGQPSDIQIRYAGHNTLGLNNGTVIVTTNAGSITEQKPYAYDAATRREVKSSYILNGNTLSFDVAASDHDIVIDPVLNWGTYYGNPGATFLTSGKCSAADSFGNSYLCGSTVNPNLATFGTAHQYTIGGNTDGFIVQFDANGARTWATYYGGSLTDMINAARCDLAGNLYVAGATFSTSAIAGGVTGTFPHQTGKGSGTGGDGFIAKFGKDGVFQWGSYYGGSGDDNATVVAPDNFGSVYIGGTTNSPNTSNVMATVYQTTSGPSYIAKFMSATGARSWGTYFNGDILCLATDSKGNLLVGGGAAVMTGITSPLGVYQPSPVSGSPRTGYVTKFRSNGNFGWGTCYGGEKDNTVSSIACDSLGNIYIGGFTTSTGNIASSGAFMGFLPSSINYTGMLACLDSAGKTRKWGTYYPGHITGVVLGPEHKLYIGGHTDATTNVATPGAYQTAFAGPSGPSIIGADGFLGKFDLNGQRLWGTYFGGPSDETEISITYGAPSAAHKLYISGNTRSDTMIATNNGFQGVMVDSGHFIGFLSQSHADTHAYTKYPFLDTLLCAGGPLKVNYKVTNTFRAGNVFTVQLSNVSGSFAAPVNIGSITSSEAGMINCTLPVATPNGYGYRIRLISTLPADTFYNYDIPLRISRPYKPEAKLFSTQVCEGKFLIINDINAPAPPNTNYVWTGPNSYLGYFSSVSIPVATLAYTGTFYVETDNYSCKGRDTVSVTITPKPAPAVITGDTILCIGDTLKLFAQSPTPGVTYVWLSPKFNSQIGPAYVQPYIDHSDVGLYRVNAIDGVCESDPSFKGLVVHNIPYPQPSAVDSSVCAGDSLILTVNDTIAGVTYKWSGPAGFSSTTKDNVIPNATISNTGNYLITTTSAVGCQGTGLLRLTVRPMPEQVEAESNAPICEGKELQLFAKKETMGAQYRWTGPNSYQSQNQNPVIPDVPATQQGIYKVVVDLDGCTREDTTLVRIDITPDTPVVTSNSPVFTGGNLKLTVLNPQAGATYSWNGPNNFSPVNVPNPIIRGSVVPADSGIYTIISTIGVCSVSDTINVVIMDDTAAKHDPTKPPVVFPIPNNGTFTIRTYAATDRDVQIIIYASDGKEVYRATTKPDANTGLVEHKVEVTSLADGVYRLKVIVDNKIKALSFTVKS